MNQASGMPELPEVETIRRGLDGLIVGQTFSSVDVIFYKTITTKSLTPVIGSKVLRVARRGKVLIVELTNNLSLLVHLKMTGQLILVQSENKRFGGGHPTKSMTSKLPDSSTRAVFVFRSGDRLFFNDQRKFGWIKLIPTGLVDGDSLIARLGPEPLSEGFTLADFKARLQKRSGPIKAVLLDQSTVAGLGNIYVDEALHMAKIHPSTPANAVSNTKVKALYIAIPKILNQSLGKGGTSFTPAAAGFVNHMGFMGDYLKHARVFRREGKPCPECHTTINKIRVAGRGTHICPKCQREP